MDSHVNLCPDFCIKNVIYTSVSFSESDQSDQVSCSLSSQLNSQSDHFHHVWHLTENNIHKYISLTLEVPFITTMITTYNTDILVFHELFHLNYKLLSASDQSKGLCDIVALLGRTLLHKTMMIWSTLLLFQVQDSRGTRSCWNECVGELEKFSRRIIRLNLQKIPCFEDLCRPFALSTVLVMRFLPEVVHTRILRPSHDYSFRVPLELDSCHNLALNSIYLVINVGHSALP